MSRNLPAKNVRIIFEADTYEEDGDTFGLWIDTDSDQVFTNEVLDRLESIPGIESVQCGRYSAELEIANLFQGRALDVAVVVDDLLRNFVSREMAEAGFLVEYQADYLWLHAEIDDSLTEVPLSAFFDEDFSDEVH